MSDFIGVKKLMKSPAKSPKNDLTKVPNLRKLMSPKVQKSPVNDLSQNVSGAANLFNVSGIEMLHDGSDIENSEDLFTNLTGKPAVRSYGSRRTRSLSAKKVEESEQNEKSRKTMGDLPVYSPRVAQWVEEHQEKSRRTSRRSGSNVKNKSRDNVDDEVEFLYNTSRRRSARNSVTNSLVEQSEKVSADCQKVDVNNSHLENSSRKSKRVSCFTSLFMSFKY